MPLNVRYHKVLSILLVVVGAAGLFAGLATNRWASAAPGIVLALLGVLMLANPMMVLHPHEVQVRNPLGMVIKRYPVNGPGQVQIQGNALYYAPTGKKIASLGFGVDPADANRVRMLLGVPLV